MLNGKFYTGLPPKMINRTSNSPLKDHQQSHIFWPDDTDTESAVETRVRRRASLSLQPSNRPPLLQKRSSTLSTADERDEVDTKQMLHKEFAKSSIQFNDNINEEGTYPIPHRCQSLLRSGKHQEITQKPTATKLELPSSETDTAASKKKHVYDSKVEFYDFINDDLKNTTQRAKINMNNKKDLERNSKNSPKLQNKSTVNKHMQLNTQQSQNTRDNMFQDSYKKPINRFRAASEFPQDKNYYKNDEYDDEEKEIQRISRAKSLDPKRRNNIYRRDQTPKRIIKPVLKNGDDYSDYPECRDDFLNESVDSLSETMTNVQINGRRPPPRKRVTYSEEEEEIPVHHFYSNKINDNDDDLYNRKLSNHSKYSDSNANTHSARYKATNNNRRPPPERSNSTDGDQTDTDQQQNNQRQLNNKPNRSLNKINGQNIKTNNNNNNNKNNEAQENLQKMSTTSKVRANNWSMSTENRHNNEKQQAFTNSAHNHLRSSLCFYNGEIVASDNEAANSSVPMQQRRNARNAATKRVSVGLPD